MALSVKQKQETLERNAAQLLEECSTVLLSSINEQGFPRTCAITKIKANGFSEIFFETSSKSKKVRHFLACDKAGVCFYQGQNSVTLVGRIEIIKDMHLKKEIWNEVRARNHFQKGPELPTYCVLRFRVYQATFWIQKSFGTYTYPL